MDISLSGVNTTDLVGLFMMLAGFVIGLGAVTVIDLHGFLGQHSNYWTEATTRTHKVTKPMIWIGISLVALGGLIFYRGDYSGIPTVQAVLVALLVLNGTFLTFRVSPFLLKRERQGKAAELLPASWQRRIMASFVISVIGWWGSLALLTLYLVR
ncbi:hypothetical protein EXS54_00970 [Patescibacteria group bacterium]|nr:hypothetical protein [Patescibacteria group bacterium]